MVPGVGVTGPSTFAHGDGALETFNRILSRDGLVGDEEGLNGDSNQGGGVLHHSMHNLAVDVHVLSLEGLISTGSTLPTDFIEGDCGQTWHLYMVLLLVFVLPLPVTVHEVAVVAADGHGQLVDGATQHLLIGEELLPAGSHRASVGSILLQHVDFQVGAGP